MVTGAWEVDLCFSYIVAVQVVPINTSFCVKLSVLPLLLSFLLSLLRSFSLPLLPFLFSLFCFFLQFSVRPASHCPQFCVFLGFSVKSQLFSLFILLSLSVCLSLSLSHRLVCWLCLSIFFSRVCLFLCLASPQKVMCPEIFRFTFKPI